MSQAVKIYHNPRCSKSRQTLKLLQDNGIEPNVVEYLKDPPDRKQLKEIVELLGINATKLVRTKESLYREVRGTDELTDAHAIDLMVAHPKLMERPIVVTQSAAVIGRPPENVLQILDS